MGLGRPFYSQKPSPIYKASVVLDGFSGSLITSVGFITNRKEQGRELGTFFPFEDSFHQWHIFSLHPIGQDLSHQRHVMLPRELSKQVPKTHLMSEEEWRRLGVQQSLGWVHYMIHEPEPHILLFRRPLPKEQQK